MIARTIILAVRIYQRVLSPLKPPTCRFLPTCSAYTIEAVQRHGALRAVLDKLPMPDDVFVVVDVDAYQLL